MKSSNTIANAVGFVGVMILVAIVISLFMAWPVMWIWNNALVPAVTFAKPVTWIQTWLLLILARAFFPMTSVKTK